MTDLDREADRAATAEEAETGPTLVAVPLMSELGGTTAPREKPPLRTTFGAEEVADFASSMVQGHVDWPTVVELRRQASTVITEERAAPSPLARADR